MSESLDSMRLDKWLWAARFFKTRSLAKSAIESNKVKVNEQNSKPKRLVTIGDTVKIKQQGVEREIVIEGLNEQRRPFSEARNLYQETSASIEQREEQKQLKHLAQQAHFDPGSKPTKKQRRDRIAAKNSTPRD